MKIWQKLLLYGVSIPGSGVRITCIGGFVGGGGSINIATAGSNV